MDEIEEHRRPDDRRDDAEREFGRGDNSASAEVGAEDENRARYGAGRNQAAVIWSNDQAHEMWGDQSDKTHDSRDSDAGARCQSCGGHDREL